MDVPLQQRSNVAFAFVARLAATPSLKGEREKQAAALKAGLPAHDSCGSASPNKCASTRRS
eukprot:362782-Chlamydomonas_euryale.AAC.5